MATVQLPGSKQFDAQIPVHTSTLNTDVGLSLGFKRHLSNESRKHGFIDHGKHKKRSSKKKWKNREYYVQHNKDGEHQEVKCIVP